jgi:hypothetical protein
MLSEIVMGYVSMMLGPSGMKILDWYVQNNLYVNGAIVTFALLYTFFPNHREKIIGKLREFLPGSWFDCKQKDTQVFRFKQDSRSRKDPGTRSRK